MTEPVIAAFVTERVKEAPKLLDYIWESKAVRNARWEAILAKLRDLRDGHVAAVAHNKQHLKRHRSGYRRDRDRNPGNTEGIWVEMTAISAVVQSRP